MSAILNFSHKIKIPKGDKVIIKEEILYVLKNKVEKFKPVTRLSFVGKVELPNTDRFNKQIMLGKLKTSLSQLENFKKAQLRGRQRVFTLHLSICRQYCSYNRLLEQNT